MAAEPPETNAHPVREACRRLLADAGISPAKAQDLERGVFNAALTYAARDGAQQKWDSLVFRTIYEAVARSACVNVRSDVNPGLRAAIDDDDIAPHLVSFMKPDARMPEKYVEIKEKAAKRNEVLASGNDILAWSSAYTCSRCKQSKTRFFELQTRSADEPMTLFVICGVCNKRWRE